jgi:hypothetical protein
MNKNYTTVISYNSIGTNFGGYTDCEMFVDIRKFVNLIPTHNIFMVQ